MRQFNPADYGPVIAPLVSIDRCRSLGAGSPDPKMRAALELATVEAAFAQSPLADRDMGACVIAGVWLLHDYLDESHARSQDIDTPTGAFWHGIMHRREGDFSNAKYWFRRVGRHEVLEAIGSELPKLGRAAGTCGTARRLTADSGAYDPFAMVDACEAATRGGADAEYLKLVQQAEWELLLAYSYREAVGSRL